ncbi:hypothetical protein EV401DRAFT_2240424 [Pisolithus croceorrhizus]|nr:hypothetical protein EV401DRAFT_2240424 [Pisolithus croceorrhizus]
MKTTLADETKPRYVGPVDPSQFLDNYLPCSNSSPAAPCLNEKEFDTLRGVATATSENVSVIRGCATIVATISLMYVYTESSS